MIKKSKRKKYCCKKCFYIYRKRPIGLVYDIKIKNKTWFKKGVKSWNSGKINLTKANRGSIKKGEHKSKKTEFTTSRVIGKNNCNWGKIEEKNHNWKGDNIKYNGLHDWLKRQYGKANYCENRKKEILAFVCTKKSNNYDWALIKGKKYERKRRNFIKLCHSCHLKYDKSK